MASWVVIESMWGNTRAVGEAIARGLADGVTIMNVAQAPPNLPADLDLLVVGGPTHAFSMSRDTTRHDAVERGADANEERGIREWLDGLPSSNLLEIATFDTRVLKVKRLPGSAAKAAANEVRRHHLGRVIARASFYVGGMEGPLLDGEIERAEKWGTALASRVRSPAE